MYKNTPLFCSLFLILASIALLFLIFYCSDSVAKPSQIISQHFWPRKSLWLLCFRFDWFAFIVYKFLQINHAVIKSITGFKLIFVQLLKKFIKMPNQAQVNRGNHWYCKLYIISDCSVLINIKVLKSRNMYWVKIKKHKKSSYNVKFQKANQSIFCSLTLTSISSACSAKKCFLKRIHIYTQLYSKSKAITQINIKYIFYYHYIYTLLHTYHFTHNIHTWHTFWYMLYCIHIYNYIKIHKKEEVQNYAKKIKHYTRWHTLRQN